ncbi:uncharacterized protein B0H18DRAFT_645833 [Fomitopsis serialis]|uniref:uncharacterized protein n=1 Tax=Fomitopsis serialis TaxID=139415 RepID=UPI002007C6A5|nr:uncharacterized protein B0H18DRAFT_645833 [Neoantrodia serialis]KAH9933446.1 hypothetical protein B0H18DRAFT_645833 [Neoantrodia serialis]
MQSDPGECHLSAVTMSDVPSVIPHCHFTIRILSAVQQLSVLQWSHRHGRASQRRVAQVTSKDWQARGWSLWEKPPARRMQFKLEQCTQLAVTRRLDKARRAAWNRSILGLLTVRELRALTIASVSALCGNCCTCFYRSVAREDDWPVQCRLPHADLHAECLAVAPSPPGTSSAHGMTKGPSKAKRTLHRGRRTSVRAVWEPSKTAFPRLPGLPVAPPPFAATEVTDGAEESRGWC